MKTLGLCALAFCMTALVLTHRPENADDFRSFYRGAQLLGTPQGVYAQPTLSPATGERGDFLPYIRIPSYALMLKPLTALSYPKARAVWVGLNLLAFAAMIPLFGGRRDKLAVALCFSLPVMHAILLGQDIAFVILISMTAAWLASSGRPYASGLVASLLAIKVIYLLPAGLVFLARSRKGTYALALGTLLQIGVSFVVAGSRWPFEYLALLRNPAFDLEPRRMPNLRGIAASLSLPSGLYIVGALALCAWLWMRTKKLPLRDALFIALPLGMLASPHAYIYDVVVAIPALIGLASMDSAAGMLAFFALSPLPCVALTVERAPAFLPGASVLLLGSVPIVAATIAAVARASRPPELAPMPPAVAEMANV